MREFEAKRWRIRDHDAYYPTLTQQLHRLDIAKVLAAITKIVVRIAIDLTFVKTQCRKLLRLWFCFTVELWSTSFEKCTLLC